MKKGALAAALACLILGACDILGAGDILGGGDSGERAERSYILSTASTGGTYYPVGVAISTLIKLRLQESHGIALSAINSAGSGENVKLMRGGEADFALIQGLFGVWAKTGRGAYGGIDPQLNLRAIGMLWPNVEHFIIRKEYARTGTLEDLKHLGGAKFAVGNRNSGAALSTGMIFDQLGIREGVHLSPAYLSYGAAADALQNGTIAGMNTPAGAPVSAVSRAFATQGGDLVILAVTSDQLTQINKGVGLWRAYRIKPGVYPGQDVAVQTAAQPNFLAVNAEVDAEVVYEITRVIYENLEFLYSVHRATRAMTLQGAIDGLPVPLHPGAIRFYREAGIEVPPSLEPPELRPEPVNAQH